VEEKAAEKNNPPFQKPESKGWGTLVFFSCSELEWWLAYHRSGIMGREELNYSPASAKDGAPGHPPAPGDWHAPVLSRAGR